jgi:hypothetical protein
MLASGKAGLCLTSKITPAGKVGSGWLGHVPASQYIEEGCVLIVLSVASSGNAIALQVIII